MKKIILLITAFASFSVLAQNGQRIIVKLKPGIKITAEALTQNTTGIAAIDKINTLNHSSTAKQLRMGKRNPSTVLAFTFPETARTEAIIKSYESTGLVEYAEKDAIGKAGGVKAVTTNTPSDDFYYRQWGLNNNGSFNMLTATSGADIQMEDAWNIELGSNSIVVATMDSGLKLDHPEFEGRLWANTLEIEDNGIDDDNNGYIDDINGWDFVNNDNLPVDDHGHGTNVTGIIGANGNNIIGYSGIDSNCKLMTLKGISADNFGFYTWWAEAIVYAADNGANVINLSVGGDTYSSILKEAIDYALENGVTVVACMMNTNTNLPYYPANYEGVIAVGATNPDDTRTVPFFWDLNSGSNYGSHISIVAPGNFIYGLSNTSDTNYDDYWGGTSQATPAVAGIAALLLAQDPSRTPAQIKSILETTAEDQVGNAIEDTEGFDEFYGHGRVNAYNALQQSLSVNEYNIKNTLIVYPNPSEGMVTIELKDYPARVTVLNMIGQLILTKNINAEDNTINIKEKGIFLISATNSTGSATNKIIIK
ncbi:S8 family serine peptidase [Flavobacterium hauense]